MLVFNPDPVHLKSFYIAATGMGPSGGVGGNYSLLCADFINYLFRIPYWVSSAWQPTDAGWVDMFTASPRTGNITMGVSTKAVTVNGGVTMTCGSASIFDWQSGGAGTGVTISSAGNFNVNNTGNVGKICGTRIICNTDASSASLVDGGIVVSIQGGGHGIYGVAATGLGIAIANSAAKVASWDATGASASKGNYSHTPIWNDAGVALTAHLCNITNTASAAGSLIFDWQIGGTSILKLSKASLLTMTGSLTVTAAITGAIFIGSTSTISGTDIDWSVGEFRYKTLSANTTLTFSNVTEGETIYVGITNTASNWTLTWPAMSWVGGITPVQTIGAKTDWYAIWRVNGITWGSYLQGY
jgi:hypothetical protein